MSGKRKDSRGRVLRNGEIQESNGRYRYKYVDSFGEGGYKGERNRGAVGTS